MKYWRNEDYGWRRAEANGTIVGRVCYVKGEGRHTLIVASAQTPTLPLVQRSDFVTVQSAREWADCFLDTALELMQLRETVKMMREQEATR